MRQASLSDRGEQLTRARPDRHALAADAVGDIGHEPLADHVRRHRLGRLGEQVTDRPLQAAAEQLDLVCLRPVCSEPGHDRRLGLQP